MLTDASRRLEALRPRLAVSASCAIGLPFLGMLGLSAGWVQFLITLVMVVAGVLVGAAAPKSRAGAVVAAAIVAVVAFGIAQSESPGAGIVMSGPLGLAVGLLWPSGPASVLGWDRRPEYTARRDEDLQASGPPLARISSWEKAPFLALLLAYTAGGREVAALVTALYFAAVALVVATGPFPSSGSRVARWGGPAAAALLTLVCISIVGMTTPRATWFGALTVHGPRDSTKVALTFDDGPNPPHTLDVLAVLQRYGVKATFFSVGSAVKQRPDVAKALVAEGHLVGNHAFNHNSKGYLDPRYPELAKAQDAIREGAGVCPAMFRPPHGTHTPFMSRVAARRDMRIVNWDVSAADWATSDPQLVAQRVLDKARGGSIILLHDGLDGRIGADRSVVVQALPLIIEGLRRRGLQPVRLDELVGLPAYVESC